MVLKAVSVQKYNVNLLQSKDIGCVMTSHLEKSHLKISWVSFLDYPVLGLFLHWHVRALLWNS